MVYNHHLCVVPKHFQHPKRNPHTQEIVSPCAHLLPAPGLLSVSMELFWIQKSMAFCFCLLPFSLRSSGFIQVTAFISAAFLFMAE